MPGDGWITVYKNHRWPAVPGPKSQYFEVEPVETGPRPTPQRASRTDQFKAAKQEMQRAFEKAEKEENRRIKETDEA
ncbi:hypothetical protein V496_02557 [Pseudogymnoascus sp. VKM F-4515 (FW-2607)]|nr:hypothetical protein V496_02557 [Pseudogymnoascus sp. VKM F-4515 (FW-2607)]